MVDDGESYKLDSSKFSITKYLTHPTQPALPTPFYLPCTTRKPADINHFRRVAGRVAEMPNTRPDLTHTHP